MAVTFTPVYRANLQENVSHTGIGIILGSMNLGNSYSTNGEPIDLDLIFSGLEAKALQILFGVSADGTTHYVWDSANAKVKAFVEDGTSKLFVEAANNGDLSAATKTAQCIITYRIGQAQDDTPITL